MTSTCAKCGSISFEMKENSPRGSNYKLFFVQCAVCGAPIGSMEYFNSGVQIEKVNKQIQNLEDKLNNIEYILKRIK